MHLRSLLRGAGRMPKADERRRECVRVGLRTRERRRQRDPVKPFRQVGLRHGHATDVAALDGKLEELHGAHAVHGEAHGPAEALLRALALLLDR